MAGETNNQVGTLQVVTSFKEGDFICAKQTWDIGLNLFYRASKHDVAKFSGKAYEFVMVIRQCSVKSVLAVSIS